MGADDLPVRERELLEFLFPTAPRKTYHSPSAALLFIFAQYGPLVNGSIVAGRAKQPRPLSSSELRLLVDQLQREELVEVYVGGTVLTPEEQNVILREARHLKPKAYDYTQAEVKVMRPPRLRPEHAALWLTQCMRAAAAGPSQAFLAYVRTQHGLGPDSDIPFRHLQDAILDERAARAEELRMLYRPLVIRRTQSTPLRRGPVRKPLDIPPVMPEQRSSRALLIHGLRPGTDLRRAEERLLGQRTAALVGHLTWRVDASDRPTHVAGGLFRTARDCTEALAHLEGHLHEGRRLHVELAPVPQVPLGSYAAVEHSLATQAFSMAQLGHNVNAPGLRQNALLVRETFPSRLQPRAGAGRRTAAESKLANATLSSEVR